MVGLSDWFPGLRPGTPFTERWRSFLSDLGQQGVTVDPTQSGGFNKRNIAGTSTPSLHGSDRAYDVNWRANPEGSVQNEYDIARQHLERDMGGSTAPITQIHPMIARETAARHGMRWGGDFQGRSPDPMHFEIAGQPPAGMPGRSLIARAGLTPPSDAPRPNATDQWMGIPGAQAASRVPPPSAPSPTPVGPSMTQPWFPPLGVPGFQIDPRLNSLTGPTIPQPPGSPGIPNGADLWSQIQAGNAQAGITPNPTGAMPPVGPQVPPFQPPETRIEAPMPMPPDMDAIMAGATNAQTQRQQTEASQPGYFERLMSNPAFLAGLSILGTAPGGNWGPNAAQAIGAAQRGRREESEYRRQESRRSTMDRIWAEAFPNGQPNTQHPLLAGQSPQVAAMIYGMGPETALPLLARSAMERRQLEFKEAGGQAFVFDPRTGQAQPVPGTREKPPSGFRWAEGQSGQLEPIPGGPGEHIASEVAGRLAIMKTAQPQLPAARQFFTRQWGPGEMARNTVGGSVVAPEYDRHRRTVRLAVEGSLRAMTGAAAPQAEVDQYMSMFMPAVTDPPQIAAQKLDMLDQFMRNAEEIVTRGRRPAGSQQPQQQGANDPLGIR